MIVKELIQELLKYPQDKECVLAINRSGGFPSSDIIEIYPIEYTYIGETNNHTPPYSGYFFNKKDSEKVILYCYP